MYHQRRKFLLRSSNPALVSFAADEVSIPALEQRNLGLQVFCQLMLRFAVICLQPAGIS